MIQIYSSYLLYTLTINTAQQSQELEARLPKELRFNPNTKFSRAQHPAWHIESINRSRYMDEHELEQLLLKQPI